MNLIARLGRKAYTLSLILSDLQAFRRGVNVHDLRKFSGQWLQELDIRTVLDIGANSGQSARLYRYLFPRAAIFAFEPLPECYKRLMQSMKSD